MGEWFWNGGLIPLYRLHMNIRFKTPILRPDLCDYRHAYIVVKGRITVESTYPVNRENKNLTFKNIAPVWSCISKINYKFIDNAEDLAIVMLMYNVLEYSDNCSMTSRKL